MVNPNIAGINYCLQPVNYSAKITYKSELIGNHKNEGVARYSELNQNHLSSVAANGNENKQIFTYEAPWLVYSIGFSWREQ